MIYYATTMDARIALLNSGVYEWFDFKYNENGNSEFENEVVEWLWLNDASPEQAAAHFGVE